MFLIRYEPKREEKTLNILKLKWYLKYILDFMFLFKKAESADSVAVLSLISIISLPSEECVCILGVY